METSLTESVHTANLVSIGPGGIDTPNLQSKWVNFVKKTFDDTGRPDIWLDEGNARLNCITLQIKRILIDQYQQAWRANIQNSSKDTIYQLFKDLIELEKYFLVLDCKQYLTL